MKRSQTNQILQSAQAFLDLYQFRLPPFSTWTDADWESSAADCQEIVDCQLGWDITDFGSGDFAQRGLTLFTLRNGKPGKGTKSYAEKIMVVEDGQETPAHFHFQKTEDIINRAGGTLVLQLWNSDKAEGKATTPVTVSVDGIVRTLECGGMVRLSPGESICLPRRLYHRFYAEGRTLVGEVSEVNNDHTDNRFFESVGRFPNIDEDVAAWRRLVSDYPIR